MNSPIIPQYCQAVFRPEGVYSNGNWAGDGGYTFPFLTTEKWEVRSNVLSQKAVAELTRSFPTLRIVKDASSLDIEVWDRGRHINTETFLNKAGLKIEKPSSPRTCKRLSRIFRPSKWFGFMAPETVYELDVDKDLWDGINHIGYDVVEQLGLPPTGRYEGTVITRKGQAKGHFLVVNRPGIGVPKGSWKPEVTYQGPGVFVDFRPVHAKAHVLDDVQTLVNLHHEIFTNRQYLGWLHAESVKFLDAMRSGDAEERLAWLLDEMSLQQIQGYPVFEWIASGGPLAWSQTMTRQFGKAWSNRVRSFADGIRLPVPGFRVYLTAAEPAGYKLQPGECAVDLAHAALVVSDTDYKQVAAILGGGDQDDAVNCLSDGNFLLASRNPNARGEFVVLRVFDLPEKLPRVDIDFGLLEHIHRGDYHHDLPSGKSPDLPYPQYVNWLMRRASERQGTLGVHVNVITAHFLTHGIDAPNQPASLEQIIDACSKDLDVDLCSVRTWDRGTAKKLSCFPLCYDAIQRLEKLLPEDFEFIHAEGHWLDELVKGIEAHMDWFSSQVRHLAEQATPPEPAYQDLTSGKLLRSTYNWHIAQGLRLGQLDEDDFEQAREACQVVLAKSDSRRALLSAYALSGFSGSDACVWQKGIAPLTFEALREAGILAQLTAVGDRVNVSVVEPNWTLSHVQVNMTWWWLLGKGDYSPAKYKALGKAKADAAKVNVAKNAGGLVGRSVHFVIDGVRRKVFTDAEKFLGYVAKGQEDRVGSTMLVVAANADDGNLQLVLL